MSLIKKANEITVPQTIKCLIYGSAGVGKTSLALSAPAPLLLDFDNGASRLNAEHRADTVQIQTWQNVKDVLSEDLSEYQSIVVDTVGKMIDLIITHVCGVRQPQIRDWGAINQEFTWFCRTLNSLQKNIIFVAHRDTRKEGDNTIFIPAIREKNYNAIVTELDLMGYIESKNNKRSITFDFSDRNDGKNTCNLPKDIIIPTTVDAKGQAIGENNFFEVGILQGFKKRLEAEQRLTQAYTEVCKDINESLEMISDAESANMFMTAILTKKDYKHIGSSKAYAKKLFLAKAQELGLKYNKETELYVQA